MICFFSCSIDSPSDKIQDDNFIPELLQRATKVQLGKEWDEVQNDYVKYKLAILENVSDHKSKILLSQLFIKEARVTGEHGHYYQAALKILNDILDGKNLDTDMKFLALTIKAGVQLSLHDFKEALLTGNQAALLNPSNAQIHGVLVDANVELGNYEKAILLLDRMISIKPDIRSYSRVSYLREIHGDVKGSKQAMQMAIKAGYPGLEETAWAMQTLGDMYKNYGDLDTAKMIYNSILEMRPNYPFAVGGLGEIELERNLLDEAEATLKEAIDIIPEVGFYFSLAQVYQKQGRHEEFEMTIEEILTMLKEDTESGHNMNLEYADLYLNILNNASKALEYAEKEYLKRPENVDVNLMMSQIKFKLGELENAKMHFEKSTITNSKNPKIEILKHQLEYIM